MKKISWYWILLGLIVVTILFADLYEAGEKVGRVVFLPLLQENQRLMKRNEQLQGENDRLVGEVDSLRRIVGER